MLTAREKEYFIGIYDKDFKDIQQPQHVTEDQLAGLIEKKENIYIVTDAAERTIGELHISNNFQIDPDTKIDLNSWASYSFEKYNCNHFVNLMTAEPFYLKQVYTHK